MAKYLKTKRYMFTLTVSTEVDGIRFNRSETHYAKGDILNAIVEKEGEDAIDLAVIR